MSISDHRRRPEMRVNWQEAAVWTSKEQPLGYGAIGQPKRLHERWAEHLKDGKSTAEKFIPDLRRMGLD